MSRHAPRQRPARGLVLGAAHRGEERAANAALARVTGTTPPAATREPDAGAPAPPSVAATVGSAGRPLDADERARQAGADGRAARAVRLHEDAAARRSAREIGARAYAVGNDVVLGDGLAGPGTARDAVLAHELEHVAQTERGAPERHVRRFNLFEAIADLFVGEFSERDLLLYLRHLEDEGEIENDMDSDNKARAVVAQGMHRGRSYDVQHLLCEEMMTGIFDTPDQNGVLQVFEDAEPQARGRLLEELGAQELFDRMDEEQANRLFDMVEPFLQADRPPVPLDWRLQPVIRERTGERIPDDYRDRMRGLFLDRLDVERGGERDSLASGKAFGQRTGSGGDRPRLLRANYPHPAETDGRVHALVDGAIADDSGELQPLRTTAAGEASASYDEVRYGHQSALVRLEIEIGFAQADFSTSFTLGGEHTTTTNESHTTIDEQSTADISGGEEEQIDEQARMDRLEGEQSQGVEAEGEAAASEGRSSTTETELAGRIEVSGTIGAELRAEIATTLGLQIPELSELIPVDDLLEAAGGSELLQDILQQGGRVGRAFAGVLNTIDVVSQIVDQLDLSLTIEPSGSFSLSGTVSGELRRRWSETIESSEELRLRLQVNRNQRQMRAMERHQRRTDRRMHHQAQEIRSLQRTIDADSSGTSDTISGSMTVDRQPLRPVLAGAPSMTVTLEPAGVGDGTETSRSESTTPEGERE
jgi:hypothetical protein